MTDIARAVMLIEYDDGTRRAWSFTDVTEATVSHQGLPGVAVARMVGVADAIWDTTTRQFIEAIATLEPREEHHEPGE